MSEKETAAVVEECDPLTVARERYATMLRQAAALPSLLRASEKVLAGLCARIRASDGKAVPVFDGIAELHTAIRKAKAARKPPTPPKAKSRPKKRQAVR